VISKRHIGFVLLAVGAAAVIAVLAVDWIGAGEFSGIGPVQRLALAAGGLVALIGISLIPFGNRPA